MCAFMVQTMQLRAYLLGGNLLRASCVESGTDPVSPGQGEAEGGSRADGQGQLPSAGEALARLVLGAARGSVPFTRPPES